MTLITHHNRQKRIVIITIIACVVLAVVSFVIGYVSKSTSCDTDEDTSGSSSMQRMTDKQRNEMHQSIVDLMKTEELKKNMK